MIKKRTLALSRALSQESVSNNIMAAVRGSLDYDNTLKTVVSALGKAFETDFAVLYPAQDFQSSNDCQLLPIYQPDRTDDDQATS